MKIFYVYFAGNSGNKTPIQAKSRKEAISLFAAIKNINVSDYILTSKTI